jgi:carbamoyltransferase
MNILGLNAWHADASVALVRDGELVMAVEDERFRRIKHWAGFPDVAIQRVLEIAGLSGTDIDLVAIGRKPSAHFARKALYAARYLPKRAILDRARNAAHVSNVEETVRAALALSPSHKINVQLVEHHVAHLSSAFHVSPFEDAAIASIDGMGDFVSTMTATGKGNAIDVLDRVYFPHSAGFLYTAITQYLGFTGYGDEFKIMGLAPYGKPEFKAEISKLVKLKSNGMFELDLRYFRHAREGVTMEWDGGYPTVGTIYTPELERLLGPARKKDEPVTDRHEAIAASVQAVYEDVAFHILRALHRKANSRNLCLAGGCAMNSVANGKIRAETPFEDVYVQPAAADNGTSVGAAFYAWNATLGKPRTFHMQHGYWGTEYGDADIARAIEARRAELHGITITHMSDATELCETVAGMIADGNVIGWYQGRMEWGARALGNRSILADPRRADMREIINTRIKMREKFRPFAPAILEEAIDDYFVGASPDPFMQSVYPIRPEQRTRIPAVTHVDGTGRLQSVSDATNPLFARLIRSFATRTGVPILLNTSFNENEPIVEKPEQALDTFLRTKMDVIALGRTILSRF